MGKLQILDGFDSRVMTRNPSPTRREESPCNCLRSQNEQHHEVFSCTSCGILSLCIAYLSQFLTQLPLSELCHLFPSPSWPCTKPTRIMKQFQLIIIQCFQLILTKNQTFQNMYYILCLGSDF